MKHLEKRHGRLTMNLQHRLPSWTTAMIMGVHPRRKRCWAMKDNPLLFAGTLVRRS
jgi:hypothetical protein